MSPEEAEAILASLPVTMEHPMGSVVTNWKTSVGGLGFLFTAAYQVITGWPHVDWNIVVPELIGGFVGLVAKDHNK